MGDKSRTSHGEEEPKTLVRITWTTLSRVKKNDRWMQISAQKFHRGKRKRLVGFLALHKTVAVK